MSLTAPTLKDMDTQDVPAAPQQSRQGITTIPETIVSQLLPSPDLSLRSMLEFVIPISQSMNTVNDISSFFEKEHLHQVVGAYHDINDPILI